ncbi:exodeoxyribonuclease VII large subunit [Aminomonas paucivorans]|uniref:exodeoxyribonuclease VII large subunit n=1 Tax=Aminomonas paucivorans TaxID=81412 RepID=UPI00332551C3
MPPATPRLLDVDELTERIREQLSTPEFGQLFVKGEIQGLKHHPSGHVYFTLLGKNARVACALFRSQAERVLLWPKEGDEAAVQGRLDVYPPRGSYQLLASRIWPLGVGEQARAKELLREKLNQEGLFDPRLKRPIPQYPLRVGVITSRSGAAFHDVRRVAALRFPPARLLWIPSQVQGVEAADSLVRAFRRLQGEEELDCVLLVRGGGSRDDLNPFDDEGVVRAIRQCPFPVAVGVGHEVDRTLSDLAADLSAPTPSGAAERVLPDREECLRRIRREQESLRGPVARKVRSLGERLRLCSFALERPLRRRFLDPRVGDLSRNLSRLREAARACLRVQQDRLRSEMAALDALSPLAPLRRGYALVSSPSGRRVSRIASWEGETELRLRWLDGEARVRVLQVEREEEGP